MEEENRATLLEAVVGSKTRACCSLRALKAIYVALGAFAGATLVTFSVAGARAFSRGHFLRVWQASDWRSICGVAG